MLLNLACILWVSVFKLTQLAAVADGRKQHEVTSDRSVMPSLHWTAKAAIANTLSKLAYGSLLIFG